MGRGKQKLSNEQKILRGTNQPCRMSEQVSASQKLATIPKVKLKGVARKIFEYTATELLPRKNMILYSLKLLKMSKKLHEAEQYAARVLSGEQLAYEVAQLAVKRYYADFENALERDIVWIVARVNEDLITCDISREQ